MTNKLKKEFQCSSQSLKDLFLKVDSSLDACHSVSYDYKISKLKAKQFITAIMMTILLSRECSQREITSTLKSTLFGKLFNDGDPITTEHSAVSHRFATLSPQYAKDVYINTYKMVQPLYKPEELGGFNIVAEDSTLVTETSARLSEGLVNGRNQYDKDYIKKQVKYTIGYDGIGAVFADIFTEQTYLNENKALFETLRNNILEDGSHRNLYVFDRGLNSAYKLQTLKNEGVYFVGRLPINRKYRISRELEVSPVDNGCVVEFDALVILGDSDSPNTDTSQELRLLKVNVGKSVMSKKGKRNRMDDYILLITDAYDMSEQDIIEAYRQRWEIEVFFKIIKQNLSFSHFVSVNPKGLETIMYCILTLSLLLLLYSRRDNQSVKGAIFNLRLQLLDIIWEGLDDSSDRDNCENEYNSPPKD